MKLNIVTDNPKYVYEFVKEEFPESDVKLIEEYPKITVIEIKGPSGEECVYSLDGLIELARYFGSHNIRIY